MKSVLRTFFLFFTVYIIGLTAAEAQTNTIITSAGSKQAQLFAKDPETYVAENDTYALPWSTIMEKNILWKKRVWRTIDTRNPGNEIFGYKPGQALNTNFADILIFGIVSGACRAYKSDDDRFSTMLTSEELKTMLNPTSMDLATAFKAEQITKYRIKEDWLFLEKENKMVVRMVGIAPVKEITNADGTITEQPVFWLYYPDCRNYLAAKPVARNNAAGAQNWDQLFMSRNFNSKIDKVANGRTPKQ
jgi:gliding motility associated protien GldN